MEGTKSKQTTGHEEISRALKQNIQTPSMENEGEMQKVIHELPAGLPGKDHKEH